MISVPSPRLVEKVTHYLHQGFHDHSHSLLEPPPALGDPRWTDELIMATWFQAEHGRPPDGIEHRVGRSGGGFDRLDFKFLPEGEWLAHSEDIGTAISLNRRDPARRTLEIAIPIYGGGMSYGSVSEEVMVSRAIAAQEWGTLTCTGEGGYPDGLKPYADSVITQIATGLFGVREETIQRAPMIEFKYAQGAKPGLGGHLLGDKSTTTVADIRESVPWVSLFSPFPFH